MKLCYKSSWFQYFSDISYDESVWQKINVYRQKVPPGFLAHILTKGCKYLSLQRALLDGGKLNLTKPSNLKYLDLCGSCVLYNEATVLENLIASCHDLQNISLRFKSLNCEIINSIVQNGQSLQVRQIFFKICFFE